MRFLLCSILILIFSLASFSQESAFVENEIIVQIKRGESAKTLAAHLIKYDESWQLESKLISEPMRTYLLCFDTSAITLENLISILRDSRFFSSIQKNHYVKMRSSIPDDPLFGIQWQ